MTDTPICRCDVFVHPKDIVNPSGLDVISYRSGDFLQFREALLRALPEEIELQTWRPTATGDLGLQMLEWWAYLADILTFYNERIANESYLRTAVLPESVKRLIRILGYRPRPGIGATGTVAALLSAPGPITVPKGFPIQSKPGPGKEPQIFEVATDTRVARPDVADGDARPDSGIGISVFLKGTVSSIKPADQLLLLKRGWAGEATGDALVTVQSATPEKDPRGRTNTRVTFTAPPGLPPNDEITDYRLLRSTQSVGLWPYTTVVSTQVITQSALNAASIARAMERGTPLLIDASGIVRLVSVNAYSEIVWFANPKANTTPEVGPDLPAVGIPIPHSLVGFTPNLSPGNVATIQGNIPGTVLRFAWQDVGQLIGAPAGAVSGSAFSLTAAQGAAFPAGLNARPVLLEDTNATGSAANATTGLGAPIVALSGVDTTATLKPPLRLLFNLLPVSRGKTVPSEILGSGDASIAGQEFVLQKSPLTYLQTTDPAYLDGYKSTARIWVNGVEWKEAPSFFGQPPDARIFVLHEDVENKTHVQFGDGGNGARLPSGINNVVAQYRYGSGADVPDAGKLTIITQPLPGLKSIENPVPAGGGADPDSPKRIRRLAPRSVLTFGRAVSGDDYEVIASQTPGVARARAYWAFDTVRQRTLITLFVGDNPSAVTAARTALARSADPNRPVVVQQAFPVHIRLSFTLEVDAAYQPSTVADNVKAALVDPDTGLFGLNTVRIGASVFKSQIEAACLRVPGAVAVRSLAFTVVAISFLILELGARHFPGEGGFYQLPPGDLTILTEVAFHAG